MHTTQLSVFNTTLQKSEEWIEELRKELQLDDLEQSYRTLRAVLHAIRDRLMPAEAAHLGAQLPMLIRGFYYEGYNPEKSPTKIRDRDEFIEHVRDRLQPSPRPLPKDSIQAVFKLLSKHISPGELRDIRQGFPPEMRDLIPET